MKDPYEGGSFVTAQTRRGGGPSRGCFRSRSNGRGVDMEERESVGNGQPGRLDVQIEAFCQAVMARKRRQERFVLRKARVLGCGYASWSAAQLQSDFCCLAPYERDRPRQAEEEFQSRACMCPPCTTLVLAWVLRRQPLSRHQAVPARPLLSPSQASSCHESWPLRSLVLERTST